jgi:hypothetical protein
MIALLPILLCGGGCLVMCFLMMGRMNRGSARGQPEADGGTARAGEIGDGQD